MQLFGFDVIIKNTSFILIEHLLFQILKLVIFIKIL